MSVGEFSRFLLFFLFYFCKKLSFRVSRGNFLHPGCFFAVSKRLNYACVRGRVSDSLRGSECGVRAGMFYWISRIFYFYKACCACPNAI